MIDDGHGARRRPLSTGGGAEEHGGPVGRTATSELDSASGAGRVLLGRSPRAATHRSVHVATCLDRRVERARWRDSCCPRNRSGHRGLAVGRGRRASRSLRSRLSSCLRSSAAPYGGSRVATQGVRARTRLGAHCNLGYLHAEDRQFGRSEYIAPLSSRERLMLAEWERARVNRVTRADVADRWGTRAGGQDHLGSGPQRRPSPGRQRNLRRRAAPGPGSPDDAVRGGAGRCPALG